MKHARTTFLLTILMGALTAFAAGPTPTDPFSISTDHARYGKRVSQQIPAIARIGSRFFCIWYGVNLGEPGSSGEQTGCYNTLAYSDDACQTWKESTYFIPNVAVEKQSIIDPRLACTPEGHLLILIPVTAQKGRSRSVWAVQLTNPLSKDGPFTFAEPNFVDFGFVGSVATINGSLYLTANQNTGKNPAAEETGMKLHRIVSYNHEQVQTELVSKLPWAVADGSENTYFETSLAEAGKNEILAFFRGKSGQFMTRSKDAGKTWSPPSPFKAYPNAKDTKADLARSPSGHLILAFNNAPGRYNMALALSSDGGLTWPQKINVDDRKEPSGTSYPNLAFGAKPDGSYNGLIYVAYDHGRGREAPRFTKEITIAVIAEADLLAGKSDCRRFIVSK
ncbi:MAG: sialidase family protein [Roseimicrobium sp.]